MFGSSLSESISMHATRRRFLGRSLTTCTAATVLASGCSTTPNTALAEYRPTEYRLGGGDEVRIITYDEDQLTGDFRLDDKGNIALPLLGTIHAGSQTTDQLARSIERELKAKNILTHASVSVEVHVYRPIFVLGEVAKPGQYPYQPGTTMLTSVAIAGGFTYRAVRSYATVVRTREGNDKAEVGRVLPQSFIAPGDVINIVERYF